MNKFVEYYAERPYLAVILIMLALLAVFAVVKAVRAVQKRSREANETVAKLERDTALRKGFEALTAEKAENAGSGELFRGVALNLCRKIEKSADITKEFDSFSEPQKNIYALYYVLEDGGKKLSDFFKQYGKPLTVYAKTAVDALCPQAVSAVFDKMYLACDEDDETTSYIPSEIEKLNGEYSAALNENEIFGSAAKYIRENIEAFI